MARSLESFRATHEGGAILVCGCGTSLNELTDPERLVSIGVNDVGRRFHPNYLVVVNHRAQFTGDRFRHVEQSRAEYLFTQLDLGVRHPGIVRFRLGRYGGTTFSDPHVLHYTRNSPYVAVCLAAHMGARLIGVIGVDFTDHHFFARTGPHPLAANLKVIEKEYRRLGDALAGLGIQVVNLSGQSRLTAWLRMSLEDFRVSARARAQVSANAPSEQLNIVSYATTPVAGVPAILARCISARTPHRARCVWADRKYGNGVAFDGDIEWAVSPRESEAALEAADVVIVHNGKVAPGHQPVLDAKPVVTMAHNYMWNVDARLVSSGFPGVVIGQYQATLPEFAAWDVVPNPLPFWEPALQPDSKPATPTICYTPSGKHEQYAPGHRLYWHAKGYATTMRVLDHLAARHGIRCEVIRNGQVPHAESLAMKRRAHVVIDECVTGSYHRNSLEGLSAGCVVVNGVGILPGVVTVARRCAPGSDRLPFAFSRLEDLEATLMQLILAGVQRLERDGHANREWIERHWDFGAQWEQFWWPVIARALEHHRRRLSAGAARGPRTQAQCDVRSAPPTPIDRGAPAPPTPYPRPIGRGAPGEVSAVVPHGGIDRLSHLTTMLAALRQCEAIGEIIVAELGEAPTAESVVRRWADNYAFVRSSGAFERARALNVGSGLARCGLVLWIDNDLLVPPPFVARAAKELKDRRLDYLIPYASVRYLFEAELAGGDGRRSQPGGLHALYDPPFRPARADLLGRRWPGQA